MRTALFTHARTGGRRVWAVCAVVFSVSAFAVDTPAQTAPVIAAHPLNMLWGVLFLLMLVVTAWWLIRRSGGLQLHGARSMKVVAAMPVGPRERVVLIEIAGEQWLLGVAPGSVNLLHRFEQPVLTTGASADDFASKMRALLQQGLHK